MSITGEHERPQPPTSPAFSDTVTFAFSDAATKIFGLAVLGLAAGQDEATLGTGVAVVFADYAPVAVRAAVARPVAARDFEAVDVAGARTTTLTPLREWTLRFTGDEAVALDLRFVAVSEPASTPMGSAVHSTGGTQGYEQLCRVTGTAVVGGRQRTVAGLGQRGHFWGVRDWGRVALVRSVSAWIGEDLALALTAVRAAKAKSHADEALQAAVFSGGGESEDDARAGVMTPVDARLSTTYDGEGRQRRAGLELYEHEDGYPRRGAGEMLCETSVDLGRLRLDCAFFRWRVDGREGIGRYDILRRDDGRS